MSTSFSAQTHHCLGPLRQTVTPPHPPPLYSPPPICASLQHETCTDFCLSLPLLCTQQHWDKDGNLPSGAPNLISMEMGPSVSVPPPPPPSSPPTTLPLSSQYDPADQSRCSEVAMMGIKCDSMIPTSVRHFTSRLYSQRMRQKQLSFIHCGNPVFVPAACRWVTEGRRSQHLLP